MIRVFVIVLFGFWIFSMVAGVTIERIGAFLERRRRCPDDFERRAALLLEDLLWVDPTEFSIDNIKDRALELLEGRGELVK